MRNRPLPEGWWVLPGAIFGAGLIIVVVWTCLP